MLIADTEKTIQINSGISSVYMFSYTSLEGVEFYAARQYVNLTKEGRDEDLSFNEE